jgi:predicted small lipoprotein YifL
MSSPMPHSFRLALLALSAVLAACGQKGDLYMPDAAREAVPATTPPAGGGAAGAQAPANDEDDDDQNGNAPPPDAR